jgi:uncharacterized membrane-anchored protein YitT (DUF2179 family)
VVKRKNVKDVTEIIHQFSPQAFYSIEDIKRAKGLANSTMTKSKAKTKFLQGIVTL